MKALLLACIATATLLAAGCDDGAAPARGAARYRLVSVDERPLPFVLPSSTGFFWSITHGDLLLRGNGTYALGIGGGTLGAVREGRWRLDGAALRLAAGESGSDLSGTLNGDSVALVVPGGMLELRYVFRRSTSPEPPVRSGRYVLTTVDGRADLTVERTLSDGSRLTHRVLFDSITFSDGALFRRHRSERWSWLIGPDSLQASRSYLTSGSYEGRAGLLVLRDYAVRQNDPPFDTLAIVQSTLVRHNRVRLDNAGNEHVWEDVYRLMPSR